MTLRIIGGRLRGRRLEAPPGLETRPLPDRIKQSLFDWLGQDLSGMVVVDVCAGSGSFGLEALSRGARQVHLIEPGRHAQATLTANMTACGNDTAVRWHRQVFAAVLPSLSQVDLVFADPPFPWFTDQPQLLSELVALGTACLTDHGLMVIRGEQGQHLPALPTGVTVQEQRHYGRSWVAALARTIPA